MKKAIKGFIGKAVPLKSKVFQELFIIDSEKAYDGFWGRNGYNKIVLIGRPPNGEEYELITDYSDAIVFSQSCSGCTIDIPNSTGIVRLWWDKPIEIESLLSSVMFEPGEDK